MLLSYYLFYTCSVDITSIFIWHLQLHNSVAQKIIVLKQLGNYLTFMMTSSMIILMFDFT